MYIQLIPFRIPLLKFPECFGFQQKLASGEDQTLIDIETSVYLWVA